MQRASVCAEHKTQPSAEGIAASMVLGINAFLHVYE